MQKSIKRIKTKWETPLFKKAWRLYAESFPKNERRLSSMQKQLMETERCFHCEALLQEDKFIGLLFWWEFEQLHFIEHFAISPRVRNKGVGEIVLRAFIAETQKPILLEVEPPENTLQERRISFYQRLAFQSNSLHYLQPPYRIGEDFTQLLLLSYPKQLNDELFKHFTLDCLPQIYRTYFQSIAK